MADEEQGVVFSQFGVVNFSPFTKVGEFAAGLAEGKIKATKCTGCGHVEFPPRADCPGCGGKGFAGSSFDSPGGPKKSPKRSSNSSWNTLRRKHG